MNQLPIEIQLMIKKEMYYINQDLIEKLWIPAHKLHPNAKRIHALSRYYWKEKYVFHPQWHDFDNEDGLMYELCPECQYHLNYFACLFGPHLCDLDQYKYCHQCTFITKLHYSFLI